MKASSHPADRKLSIILWAPAVVAKTPLSGNDGARVARCVQRRYFLDTEIASVHAPSKHMQSC
jgi:hypothetical protein